MLRRPPGVTRADSFFPDPTLFRSRVAHHVPWRGGGRGRRAIAGILEMGDRLRRGGCRDQSRREQRFANRCHLHLSLPLAFDLASFGTAYYGSAIKRRRSEEHTSELQSLMRISYAVFCLKKKK